MVILPVSWRVCITHTCVDPLEKVPSAGIGQVISDRPLELNITVFECPLLIDNVYYIYFLSLDTKG